MKALKFYKCHVCGNLVVVLNDGGVNPECCGEAMEELRPNTTDGAEEKHVPVIERSGEDVKVKVGSVPHPMEPEHYIMWIILQQGDRFKVQYLKPGEAPEAEFKVEAEGGDLKAYEYCSVHGLWVG